MTHHPEFHCDIGHGPLSAIVRVSGEVDMSTAPKLEATLRSVAQTKRHVTLDLRELDFIDSTGIHVVIRIAELATAEGFAFAIIKGPPRVQRVFEICGLDKHLQYENLDDGSRHARVTDIASNRSARQAEPLESVRRVLRDLRIHDHTQDATG